jgi:DNA-binding NarL/FixJ family response regulator
VLILSVSPEAEFAERTLRAGAAGYISKQFASDEILLAVRKVLSGGTYVTATIAEKLASGLKGGDSRALHEELSEREFQIFRLIAMDRSVKEIACELGLSEKTVGTYLARIKDKTGLSSHVEITRYAFHHKLVE